MSSSRRFRALSPRKCWPTLCQYSFGILRSRQPSFTWSSHVSTEGSFFGLPRKRGGFFQASKMGSRSNSFSLNASSMAGQWISARYAASKELWGCCQFSPLILRVLKYTSGMPHGKGVKPSQKQRTLGPDRRLLSLREKVGFRACTEP